ncbi:class I SAM-dependent methyltransferase [Candidatus Woesearchaeota archaeon]|nr:class I SAM-dependent methyltransferase [Candidatus Woesearchaeota archaeon]
MDDKIEFSYTEEINLGEQIFSDDSSAMQIAKGAMNRGAMQKLSELHGLLEFLQGRQMNTVVEIGTAGGGTFFALCQTAPADAHIISIDLPGGPFGGGYDPSDAHIFKTYAKIGQTLFLIPKDSHDEATKKDLLDRLKDKQIDVLFIDGDHTYEGVKKDFEMYSPFVKKGGVIIFHDICKHATVPECQVDKLWNEIKDKYEHKEFIDKNEDDWGGIGIIIKN